MNVVARNCQLVVAKERYEGGGGRIPAEPDVFEFTSKNFGKTSTLSIDGAKELVCVRLVQLLKFADHRALRYRDTAPGQALLDTLVPSL